MAYTGQQKRDYQNKWMQDRRQEWIKENGPCIDCGSDKDLEVDHVDPKSKEYNPAKLWSRTKEFREKELKKCVVRCKVCHKIKTYNGLFTKIVYYMCGGCQALKVVRLSRVVDNQNRGRKGPYCSRSCARKCQRN